MNRLLFWVVVSSVLGYCETVSAQLASESKPADELLVDYLVFADEVSSSHCVRIEGSSCVIYAAGNRDPFVKALYGISATQGAKVSYHCWGQQSLSVNSSSHRPVGWREQIWDGERRYRKMSAGNTGGTARGVEEKDENGKGPALSSMNIFNPMGMVIGACSEMAGDRSNIVKKKEFFLSAKLWKSEKLANGDVVGYWIAPNGYSVASIAFGSKAGFMPIKCEFYFWDKNAEKPKKKFSEVKTKWKNVKGTPHYLPVAMFMSGVHGKNGAIEIDLNEIAWVDPEKWTDTKIDFAAIATKPNSVWRKEFLPLFDEDFLR